MAYPIIGVTSRTAPVLPSLLPSTMVQTSYTKAILRAGGLPVLIPSDIQENGWPELIARFDGILFTGGGDIAIEHFDGEPHPAVYGIEAPRDAIELGLARAAIEAGKPILGICRGLQVLNVAWGGTLYTHIPDQIENALVHEFPGDDNVQARTALAHTVKLEADSSIAKIMGVVSLQVNSLHHQGIKEVAPNFKAVAYAPDGLVEAIEGLDQGFAIAVQWHPEWLTDQVATQRLFKAFVDSAAEPR